MALDKQIALKDPGRISPNKRRIHPYLAETKLPHDTLGHLTHGLRGRRQGNMLGTTQSDCPRDRWRPNRQAS